MDLTRDIIHIRRELRDVLELLDGIVNEPCSKAIRYKASKALSQLNALYEYVTLIHLDLITRDKTGDNDRR